MIYESLEVLDVESDRFIDISCIPTDQNKDKILLLAKTSKLISLNILSGAKKKKMRIVDIENQVEKLADLVDEDDKLRNLHFENVVEADVVVWDTWSDWDEPEPWDNWGNWDTWEDNVWENWADYNDSIKPIINKGPAIDPQLDIIKKRLKIDSIDKIYLDGIYQGKKNFYNSKD